LLQVIGPKGVMLLIFAPDIRVGRECFLNLYRIYIYFNQSFINHDNVLIPCTNNFDQTRSLYYYKCKRTCHVRKSTASHSNHPECSVGRGENSWSSWSKLAWYFLILFIKTFLGLLFIWHCRYIYHLLSKQTCLSIRIKYY
jgi:hypothetical protein